MDGKKRLIMIDRKHVDVLEAADMPWRVDGSFLAVDPLKVGACHHRDSGAACLYTQTHTRPQVNMYVAGPLAKLDYYVADMQAGWLDEFIPAFSPFSSHLLLPPPPPPARALGDCLYIPKVWYHQVSSAPGRNLAVNIWWLNEGQSFNSSDCEGVDITARRTLAGEAFLQHEPSIPVLLGWVQSICRVFCVFCVLCVCCVCLCVIWSYASVSCAATVSRTSRLLGTTRAFPPWFVLATRMKLFLTLCTNCNLPYHRRCQMTTGTRSGWRRAV